MMTERMRNMVVTSKHFNGFELEVIETPDGGIAVDRRNYFDEDERYFVSSEDEVWEFIRKSIRKKNVQYMVRFKCEDGEDVWDYCRTLRQAKKQLRKCFMDMEHGCAEIIIPRCWANYYDEEGEEFVVYPYNNEHPVVMRLYK